MEYTHKVVVSISTASAIRLASGDEMDMLQYQVVELDPFLITRKIYGAWYGWLNELGFDTEVWRAKEYCPVNFSIEKMVGGVNTQGHMPHDRFTGGGMPERVWHEALWAGIFNLTVSYQKLSGLDTVVAVFLSMLNQGQITIGGGKRHGKGRLEIHSLSKIPIARPVIATQKRPRHRCSKGHIAPYLPFGGKCKCGADIPRYIGWALPPESL